MSTPESPADETREDDDVGALSPEAAAELAAEATALEADSAAEIDVAAAVPAPDAFVDAVRAAETEVVSPPEEGEKGAADDELDAPLRALTDEAAADKEGEDEGDAADVRRFLDRRRPWVRPVTIRDRNRRTAGMFWVLVYVLFMAGLTSTVSFLIVRGYLWLAPGPTNTGVRVARFVVPWVFSLAFVAFAFYVTRSIRRTLLYVLVFLLPYFTFLFIREASAAANWLVKWVPGGLRVYGLTAFGPIVALVLLGRDFVTWQLWVEFPEDACWACGARIEVERWVACPLCGNDLEAQRLEQAVAERGVAPAGKDTGATRGAAKEAGKAADALGEDTEADGVEVRRPGSAGPERRPGGKWPGQGGDRGGTESPFDLPR